MLEYKLIGPRSEVRKDNFGLPISFAVGFTEEELACYSASRWQVVSAEIKDGQVRSVLLAREKIGAQNGG